MNEERNKFLTEKVLGKCWHEKKDDYSASCFKCNKLLHGFWYATPQNTSIFNISSDEFIDFDSWQGFGVLWPVVIKKEWWPEFMVVQSTAREICGLSVIQFLTIFINPPVFATAVYEFFLHRKEVT